MTTSSCSRPATRPRWRTSPGRWPPSGRTVIGVGDQPPHDAARRRPRRARALRARVAGRRGRGARRAARARPARPVRPGGVPVGAVHDPGGADPRGVRAARHDRRADGAVPRQGADEAGARRGRHPHAAARERDHRGRGVGGRRADRLPDHRQADRGRRLGRHLPGRLRRRAGRRAAAAAARAGGERRGVRRRRGAHVRHGLRGRGDPLRERDVVPAAAAADADARVGQPGVDRAARPRRCPTPAGRRDGRAGARRARASAPASRTWSGTARRPARRCSARSPPGRPARGWST